MVVELSMVPLGHVSGLSADVSKVIHLVEKSGLPFQLTAMGTVIEGEWDEVMNLVKKSRELLLKDNERLYIVLKIDEHKGETGALRGKVKSVENRLGHPVSH